MSRCSPAIPDAIAYITFPRRHVGPICDQQKRRNWNDQVSGFVDFSYGLGHNSRQNLTTSGFSVGTLHEVGK